MDSSYILLAGAAFAGANLCLGAHKAWNDSVDALGAAVRGVIFAEDTRTLIEWVVAHQPAPDTLFQAGSVQTLQAAARQLERAARRHRHIRDWTWVLTPDEYETVRRLIGCVRPVMPDHSGLRRVGRAVRAGR